LAQRSRIRHNPARASAGPVHAVSPTTHVGEPGVDRHVELRGRVGSAVDHRGIDQAGVNQIIQTEGHTPIASRLAADVLDELSGSRWPPEISTDPDKTDASDRAHALLRWLLPHHVSVEPEMTLHQSSIFEDTCPHEKVKCPNELRLTLSLRI
jgi:hypothetical protein